MPDLKSRAEWNITVNDHDLAVLLKALGGRLANDDERAAAEVLGDKLTEIKAHVLIQQGVSGAILKESLDAKLEGRPADHTKLRLPKRVDPEKTGRGLKLERSEP